MAITRMNHHGLRHCRWGDLRGISICTMHLGGGNWIGWHSKLDLGFGNFALDTTHCMFFLFFLLYTLTSPSK